MDPQSKHFSAGHGVICPTFPGMVLQKSRGTVLSPEVPSPATLDVFRFDECIPAPSVEQNDSLSIESSSLFRLELFNLPFKENASSKEVDYVSSTKLRND